MFFFIRYCGPKTGESTGTCRKTVCKVSLSGILFQKIERLKGSLEQLCVSTPKI